MLGRTLQKGEFSNDVIAGALGDDFTHSEKAFTVRLYLGVLERLIYLDNIINRFSSVNTAKMKPVVLNIIRLSLYQLLFMNSVPDFAALNEAGKLAKKHGLGSLAPFINGVLRAVQKNACGEDGKPDLSRLEEGMPENVKLSVPKWMYESTVRAYGKDRANAFFEGMLNSDPGVVIRLCLNKGPASDIIKALEDEGCAVKSITGDDSIFRSCRLARFGNLTELQTFKDGLFTVQDTSSTRAAEAACRELLKTCGRDGAPLILDVCAAPGGKSICVAECFPGARVLARDISREKTDLIEENIKRLGAANVEAQVFDARESDSSLEGGADLVIADLPCSGIGVIGGKPDIKFRLREKDVDSLALLQKEILKCAVRYVKPGGVLAFSTCTVTEKENDENAKWLSGACADETGIKLEMVNEEKLLPADGSDGFYIAVFRRK